MNRMKCSINVSWAKITIISIMTVMGILIAEATSGKYEIRAAWLSTDGGMDWPQGKYDAAMQQRDLIDILDRLDAANFNTLYFQVQSRGGVAWQSSYYPAMSAITGDGAKNMDYDVAQFVIDQCHKRHIECHAWLVPFYQGSTNDAARYQLNGISHISTTKPELCINYNGNIYMDPGIPQGREYIVESYHELLSSYGFDGILLDLKSYAGRQFGDNDSYQQYNPDFLTKDDWRRENMTAFINEFVNAATTENPSLRIGITTLGSYNKIVGYENQTTYNYAYQDPCLWVTSGTIDYIVPQMFFKENKGFSSYLDKWVSASQNGCIIVGISPDMMTSDKWSTDDLTTQIETVRETAGVKGLAIYSTKALLDKAVGKTFYDTLQNKYFTHPAHVIPKDDIQAFAPNPPTNVTVEYIGDGYRIAWEPPLPSPDGNAIRYYSIYLTDGTTVEIDNPDMNIGAKIDDTTFFYPSDSDLGLHFAVTAFDMDYRESAPSIAQASGIDEMGLPEYIYYHQGTLYVSGNKSIHRIEIYSLTGNKLMAVEVSGMQATISCDQLPQGMFVAHIVYENGGNTVNKFMR